MVVIVFGLPGSGKSYFASRLAGIISADYINSDRVRREIPIPGLEALRADSGSQPRSSSRTPDSKARSSSRTQNPAAPRPSGSDERSRRPERRDWSCTRPRRVKARAPRSSSRRRTRAGAAAGQHAGSSPRRARSSSALASAEGSRRRRRRRPQGLQVRRGAPGACFGRRTGGTPRSPRV